MTAHHPHHHYYEITASIYSTKHQFSVAQRSSPFFTDCPVIGHHTLRDRSPLKFYESEMSKHEKDLKRLFDAHAIDIVRVVPAHGDKPAQRIYLREQKASLKLEKAQMKVETDDIPTPVEPPVVVDPISMVATEPAPVVEAAPEVVQPETTPATVEPAAPVFERKGKKGRRE